MLVDIFDFSRITNYRNFDEYLFFLWYFREANCHSVLYVHPTPLLWAECNTRPFLKGVKLDKNQEAFTIPKLKNLLYSINPELAGAGAGK